MSLDKIADKIAALGVPGLVLVIVMGTTGWAGAAALTTALAVLGGPLGMLGGIALLGVMLLISRAIRLKSQACILTYLCPVSLFGKCFFFCLPLWFVNSYQLGLSGL